MGNEASNEKGSGLHQDDIRKLRGVLVMQLPDSTPPDPHPIADGVEMIVPCQDGLDRVNVEMTMPEMTIEGQPDTHSRTAPPSSKGEEKKSVDEGVEEMNTDEVGYLHTLPSLHPQLSSPSTLRRLLSHTSSVTPQSDDVVECRERDNLMTIVSN